MKLTILNQEDAKDSDIHSLLGRIEETIIGFWDLLTFNNTQQPLDDHPMTVQQPPDNPEFALNRQQDNNYSCMMMPEVFTISIMSVPPAYPCSAYGSISNLALVATARHTAGQSYNPQVL